MKKSNNFDLLIKTKIWENEQYNLIDYDNRSAQKNEIKINTSGFLSRINDNIKFSNVKDQFNQLLEVNKNKDNYKYNINCGNWSNDLKILSRQKGAYILYKADYFKEQKSIKNKYYKLSQGDIMKLGRIYIKLLDMQLEDEDSEMEEESNKKTMIKSSSFNSSIVKGQEVVQGTFINNKNKQNDCSIFSNDNIYKFKNNNNNKISDRSNNNTFFLPRIKSSEELIMKKPKQKIKLNNSKNINNNILFNKKKKKQQKSCRICYGENSGKENPLICPCTCKGSMKFIHFLCLKNWLNSKIESEIKIHSEEETIISYNKKDIYCELCNTQYPDFIRYNGVFYNISFYKPKFKEFIMFETLRTDKNKAKYINIVSLDNKNLINIGRSKECDFSIPEISISRFHSIIHKNKGELYIEDNKSKFGTLILIQNDNIEINNYIPLKLQINNTYIKIKMNLPLFYSCCNVNTNSIEMEKLDYQEQNQKFLNVFSCFDIKDNNTNNNADSENNEEEDEDEKVIESNNLIIKSSDNKLIESNNLIIKSSENNDKQIESNNLIIKSSENNDKLIESNNNVIKSSDNDEKENNSFYLKVDELPQNNENNENNEINNNNNDNKNDININKDENLKENYNNEIINNLQIYKKNKLNNLNNIEIDNNYNNNSNTLLDLSNYNTSLININNKKNNINLIIEDCNNKYLGRMKKIKITNEQNNLNNEDNLLSNINKKFDNNLKLSTNTNFNPVINKINTLSLIDTNANGNSNIFFNINKDKNKIIINKHKFLNGLFNSSRKIVNVKINNNDNKLEGKNELIKNINENNIEKKISKEM